MLLRHKSARALIAGVALAVLLAGCAPAAPSDTAATDSATADSTLAAAIAELGDDTITVLAVYGVDGDNLVGDNINPDYAKVWERFAQLFPTDTRPEVKQFVAIDMAASDGTDGAMQVNPATGNEYIALDVTGADTPTELDRTMVHEFGHLLTLRPSQVPVDESAVATCPVYTVDKGCPASDSYLTAYFKEFWPGVLGDTWDDSADSQAARFAAEPDSFVTDYAAKNPDEDIAEIFAEWVTKDAVSGDTVKAQKLAFFDAYPEVVKLRDDIRAGLAEARP